MNIVELQKDDARRVWGKSSKFLKGELAQGTQTDAITGFSSNNKIYVVISKGTVYSTIDSYEDIQNDVAVWVPWVYGTVTSPTQGVAEPGITGIYIEAPADDVASWRITG